MLFFSCDYDSPEKVILTFVSLANRNFVRESFSTMGSFKTLQYKSFLCYCICFSLGLLIVCEMMKLTREDYFFCNSVIAKMFNNQKSGILFPWARHDKTGQDRGHRGYRGHRGCRGHREYRGHRGHRFHTKRDTGDTRVQGTQWPQVPQGTQETQ